MGLGARFVLGFLFLFSFPLTAFSENTAKIAVQSTAVDDLVEEIARLQEIVPSVGDASLSQKLSDAELLAKNGRFEESLINVLKIKNRLIAESFKGLQYVQKFKDWKDVGFFPTTDKSRDLLHEVILAISHLREDFDSAEFNSSNQVSALSRFITLQNLVSAMRLRQESAAYKLNARAKEVSHQLLEDLLSMDGSRQKPSATAIADVSARSEELSRLNGEFASIKRRESVAGATLVLNQLQELGAPRSGLSVIDYSAIPKSILSLEQFRDVGDAKGKMWAMEETSPYAQLFNQPANRIDSGQQFQVLKFELARRALEEKSGNKITEDIGRKLDALLHSPNEDDFWLRAQDVRAQIERIVPVALNPGEAEQDAALLLRVAPDALQAKIQRVAGAYSLGLDRLAQNFYSTASSWQKMNPWAERRALKALQESAQALQSFALKVSLTSDPKSMAEYGRSLHWIQLLCGRAAEAVINRSETAGEYAAILSQVILGYNGQGRLVSEAQVAKLQRLLKIERNEDFRKAWINKDTITTAALSAVLIGEAVSTVYTGGASAGAMPATLAAIRTLGTIGKTITWVARGVVAASATTSLVDRYRLSGLSGLANMESAIDVMMVLSVLPRLPLVTPTSQLATSRMGKLGQWLINHTAQLQFDSTKLLSQMMIAFSGYQLVFAENISLEYQRRGIQITPWEIRSRAALGLATSALVMWQSRQAIASARAVNPAATAELTKGMSLAESNLSQRLKGMINPYAAARDFYKVRPSWHRAMRGAAVGLGYLGMDYLLINEGILLAHTNPDFNYMYQVEKKNAFPVLNKGESALSMVGISPLDTLLYFGAHAEFSHSRERKLYGNDYTVDNYASPDDLVKRLVRHAEIHGPIRYLKIMTHGRPGMLYSQKVDAANVGTEKAVSVDLNTALDSGWIDMHWLGAKREWIRERARKAFAPDARIILWACLTGANFDKPKFGGDLEQPINIGDQFLAAFGNAFLPEGGAIDASTRILIGLGSVFGSAIHEASYAGKTTDEHYRPVVPVFPLKEEPATKAPNTKNLSDLAFKSIGPNFYSASLLVGGNQVGDIGGDASPGAWEQVKYTAGRAKYMFLYMPNIWWKYGIMLEGPWWHKWYQHVEVPPT